MPVLHYTQHAYGSWMPDRPQGYVHHARGLQKQDHSLTRAYRRKQQDVTASFAPSTQRLLIEVVQKASAHVDSRLHSVGSDVSHFHLLMSWRDEREMRMLYRAIRYAMTRALNEHLGRRTWFTKNAHLDRITCRDHFNRLVDKYHPSHRGWGWSENGGWREPRDQTCGS